MGTWFEVAASWRGNSCESAAAGGRETGGGRKVGDNVRAARERWSHGAGAYAIGEVPAEGAGGVAEAEAEAAKMSGGGTDEESRGRAEVRGRSLA